MGKKGKRRASGGGHLVGGEWISPGSYVYHPALPSIEFALTRADDGSWRLESTPCANEAEFLQGLEDLEFRWTVTDRLVEGPDLLESFDDFVNEFRRRFMEMNLDEQDQVINKFWDIENSHR